MKALCFLFVWMAFVCAWAGASVTVASSTGTVAKVVSQYALTSANDFPQRDPQDWQLLGSNDGGRSWVTLDVRKGEVFSERHQRRLFQTTNTVAFNIYRLKIDRVREPASADSVHLAEFEPLGRTEDDITPIPSFEDVVTVQGENAPLETSARLFDGQAETKWLDFARSSDSSRASWVQWQYLSQPSLVVTNVKQLQGLRAKASTGYPVRLEGILLGRLSDTNIVGFLDDTGYLEVPGDGAAYYPGQHLVIEGRSRWENKQVGIAGCRFIAKEPTAPSRPKKFFLEEPLAADEEMAWIEAEGTVQFCTQPDAHLAFELVEGEHTLQVQVLHVDTSAKPQLTGSRVKVRGVCGGVIGACRERVAGTLWVPSLDDVTVMTNNLSSSAATGAKTLTIQLNADAPNLTRVQQIRQLSPEQLMRHPQVRVSGVITEAFGSYLQDETAGIEVSLGRPPTKPGDNPQFRDYVEVAGFADWMEGHGPIVRPESINYLGKGKLPNPERPTWGELSAGKVVDRWIEIEGVVRSTDGSHLLLICDGGQIMAIIRSAPVSAVTSMVDAVVRLRGIHVNATDDRGQVQGIRLVVPSLEYVEIVHPPKNPFSMPARPIASLFQVSGPHEFARRVRIEGVLTCRDDRRFFLQDASGSAMAIGKEDVVLDSPRGAYRWAFFQTADGKAARQESWEFKPGDKLEVVGFPESREGCAPVLAEALVRKVGWAALPTPVEANVADIALGKLDSTLISLEAVMMGHEDLGSHWVFEMQSGNKEFQAVMPATRDARLSIAPGSRVRVTGVCQIEPSPFPELGKRFSSFKLLVDSPGAFMVLERPSWWTLSRALATMGALGAVLVLALGWIGILRRQVEVRTQQLQNEVEEHKRTAEKLEDKTALLEEEIEERKMICAELEDKKALLEKEIDERKRIEAEVELGHKKLLRTSRLAGMAEVATSVLHNVGNVLNGANMLAALIGEQVRHSKVPSLSKAVGLLSEHREDLGRFVTTDERGRHLPVLLEQLATHLADERTRLQGKVDALTESIQHIKEVVTMQQKYAKVSSLTETISLAEVVEDALQLLGEALVRHDVRVTKEYQETPQLTVDRHKVLQILFNLLENARHACLADGRNGREVSIQVQAVDGHVHIRISDNGIGIPAENLPRIFDQGFSTRKDGHGLGLHSSILAAQEMGGSLRVQSEGPGKGAAFTLELPIPR